MDRRRKARILSLVLALFMLLATVPGFIPGRVGLVSAQTYSGPVLLNVTASTNYGDRVLFKGFNGTITYTLNATQSGYFVNVALLFDNITVSESGIFSVNQSVATYTINVPKIPQNTSSVVLKVAQYIWNTTTGTYEVYKEFTVPFDLEPPFSVNVAIKSEVPYYNGTNWSYDRAFEYIPFVANVTITYSEILANNSLVQVPHSQNVTIVLPNGTEKTITININSTTVANLTQNNTGSKLVSFDGVNTVGNISVISTGGNFTFKDLSAAEVYRWWIEASAQYYYTNISSSQIFKNVPFNVTITVTTNSTLGKVGVNTTAVAEVLGAISGNTSANSTMTTGSAQITLTNIMVDPATVVVYLINYSAINTTLLLNATPWKINVTSYSVSYGNQISEYNGTPVFWVNVPNAVFNVTINYPITPYKVNSTANILMNNSGSLILSNASINVVNNNGSASFNVVTPTKVGNVVVSIWDAQYNVTDPFNIPVLDWNVTSTYDILAYGQYSSDSFYVGVPADLEVNATYTLGVPINSSVIVDVFAPNGTEITSTTLNITNDHGSAIVLSNYTFYTTGYITVKVYNTTLGVYTEYKIPIKDWSIYVGVTPTSLTLGKVSNITINVGESLQFPGTREVKVTLQIPGNYTLTKNLTLVGTSISGSGGYYGLVSFMNVTPTSLGLAKITVEDVLTGKTAVKYIPIEPNFAITNTTIDVTTNSGVSPVYVYVPNNLTINLQYYNIINGTFISPSTTNSIARVTVVDNSGNVLFNSTVPVSNGQVSFTIPFTVNVTGPVVVSAVDVYNSNVGGLTKVTVVPWNVSISSSLVDTLWEYINNQLTVTATPNISIVSPSELVVVVNTTNYGNVSGNGNASLNLVNPTSDLVGSVQIFYRGHLVNSTNLDYKVHEWNVTFSVEPDTVWEYVDTTLNVTVHVNGPNVPVNVSINSDSHTNVNSGQVLPYNITYPQGTIRLNITATYKGYPVGGNVTYVTPRAWNVTFSNISSYDSLTGLPDIYRKFFGNITGVVNVNGPNVPVNVSVNGDFVGSYSNGDNFTHMFAQWTSEKNWTIIATYRGHVVGNANYTTNASSWDTIVSAPDELYYLPDGYTNKNVNFTVDLSGLPENITKAYNVTIELNVTLPNGTVIHRVVNGTNSKVFHIGNLTFNESGNISYTITVIRGRPWRAVLDTKNGAIPIKLALNANIVGTYYDNIQKDFVVNVSSASPSPSITVTISGTNYTVTAYHGGIITIPNVTLTAGNYTVVISENDPYIKAIVTKTLEVRSWHLEVVPSRVSITAGSVYNVNFTFKLVDQYGEIVPVNDTACLKLEFSNTSVIPSGFYSWPGIQIVNGTGELSTQVFAPVAGTFQVIVEETHGHMNNSVVISVAPPNPGDLTYVYVNIRKEGSLVSPEKPVVLYWGLEINGIKKYFRVFTPLVEYSPDYSEAMFKLYPNSSFKLYVIAVPNNSKILQPILNESYHKSWNDTVVYTNETWYTLINKTAVVPTGSGWEIIVNVSKVKHHFENYTVLYYNYSVPTTPGVIQVTPGSASVQGNAIFTDIENTSKDYIVNETISLGNATNTTIITIKPNELMLRLCDNTTLKPTQAGEYFTFKAMLSVTNAEEQFDSQWMPFESWIQSIDFLNDTEKNEIISAILSQIGNVSDLNGPVANATLNFHIDNTDIAYIEPTNATTDENGSVTFRVYSKALANMTPEELKQLMGTVKVWTTYDNLLSNSITVQFGGAGSISGDITDNTGMQIPGATVIVKVMKNGTWVNATDFEGNILTTVSAGDGHYAIGNVPAAPNGTEYLVIAIKDNLTGYAYVTVYPFATSTADIKLSGTVEENTTHVRGLAMYPEKVDNASTVYFVFNNLGTVDAYSTSQYVARTIPINVRTKTLLASNFNLSVLNASDVVISVGGPAVNPVTAYYNSMAKVHMIQNGSQWVITTPNGTFTWTAPKPWWNATKGYFIIQIFEDNQTGAFVVTIYGTDADSTAAGAYYFMKDVYPNITRYNGISYIVGLWEDTEPGADVPLPGASQGDTSGFSAGDTIIIVAEG